MAETRHAHFEVLTTNKESQQSNEISKIETLNIQNSDNVSSPVSNKKQISEYARLLQDYRDVKEILTLITRCDEKKFYTALDSIQTYLPECKASNLPINMMKFTEYLHFIDSVHNIGINKILTKISCLNSEVANKSKRVASLGKAFVKNMPNIDDGFYTQSLYRKMQALKNCLEIDNEFYLRFNGFIEGYFIAHRMFSPNTIPKSKNSPKVKQEAENKLLNRQSKSLDEYPVIDKNRKEKEDITPEDPIENSPIVTEKTSSSKGFLDIFRNILTHKKDTQAKTTKKIESLRHATNKNEKHHTLNDHQEIYNFQESNKLSLFASKSDGNIAKTNKSIVSNETSRDQENILEPSYIQDRNLRGLS